MSEYEMFVFIEVIEGLQIFKALKSNHLKPKEVGLIDSNPIKQEKKEFMCLIAQTQNIDNRVKLLIMSYTIKYWKVGEFSEKEH
jgi:hypothetical protein